MDPLFDLTGRVVVVTGGLGQLGRAYAAALLERGARVALFDSQGDAAALRKAFPDIGADRLMFQSADVTRRDQLEKALAAVTEAWGVPHGLVNNAAIDSPPDAPASENGPFETFPESSWDKVMAVNVKGVMLCCQVIGGAMAKAGRGSIVNIGSIYGVVSPDQSLYQYRRDQGETFFKPVAYSASKSALYNLTRYLATYWAPRVRVNILTLAGVFNNQDKPFLDAYQRRIPIGRMAEPGDYNGAVIYLLSDASAYMTGSELRIDGGWTAW
jgi:NAD(P)-dependent dehydrogenase (short-subunit alcohol dehydrogenase family)